MVFKVVLNGLCWFTILGLFLKSHNKHWGFAALFFSKYQERYDKLCLLELVKGGNRDVGKKKQSKDGKRFERNSFLQGGLWPVAFEALAVKPAQRKARKEQFVI